MTNIKKTKIAVPETNPDLELHHSIICFLMSFDRKGKPGQKHFNSTIATEKPIITQHDISAVMTTVVRRSVETLQIEAKDIVDVVILSINPIGYMTQAAFVSTDKP